jgi:hypothetical protein
MSTPPRVGGAHFGGSLVRLPMRQHRVRNDLICSSCGPMGMGCRAQGERELQERGGAPRTNQHIPLKWVREREADCMSVLKLGQGVGSACWARVLAKRRNPLGQSSRASYCASWSKKGRRGCEVQSGERAMGGQRRRLRCRRRWRCSVCRRRKMSSAKHKLHHPFESAREVFRKRHPRR